MSDAAGRLARASSVELNVLPAHRDRGPQRNQSRLKQTDHRRARSDRTVLARRIGAFDVGLAGRLDGHRVVAAVCDGGAIQQRDLSGRRRAEHDGDAEKVPGVVGYPTPARRAQIVANVNGLMIQRNSSPGVPIAAMSEARSARICAAVLPVLVIDVAAYVKLAGRPAAAATEGSNICSSMNLATAASAASRNAASETASNLNNSDVSNSTDIGLRIFGLQHVEARERDRPR